MAADVSKAHPEVGITHKPRATLTGWSLGGLYTREIAKLMPAQVEDVEVPGSHTGLGWNPAVLRVVANRLAQPPGRWQAY